MYTQYYYKKKEDQTICLLRCLGESSEVFVPEYINGCKVTEVGPYCFSQNSHLQGKTYEKTVINEDDACITEQAGRFITKVTLPASIVQIGSYAFYNCRSLKEVSLYGSLREIGNDTFMNCTNLHKLNVYGNFKEKSCLPFLLVQISWNIEVSFIKPAENGNPEPFSINSTGMDSWKESVKKPAENENPEAVLYYPEYMEYYEEIGPAHVFEIQVSGEGYRARKCFLDGILLMQEYDRIFPKACAEENENTLCSMALDRLLYPEELSEESKENYGKYLKDHASAAARMIFLNDEQELTERLKKIRKLLEGKWMDAAVMEELLVLAAEKSIPEATATFISWKREFFAVKKKKRYEF